MMPSAGEGDQHARDAAATALVKLASTYQFTLLSSLTLRAGSAFVTVDHALVDRFGVLVLCTQSCGGATLRGADTDVRWTVRGHDGSICTLLNPLQESRDREATVREVLRAADHPLGADYVRSAVVFADARLTELDLGAFDRERVVEVHQIESLLRMRHDFAPNPGDIDADERDKIASALRAADGVAGAVAPTSQPGWIAVDHSAAEIADLTARHAGHRQSTRIASAVAPPARHGVHLRALVHAVVRLTPVVLAALVYWWVIYGGGMGAVVASVESLSVPEGEAFSLTAADPSKRDHAESTEDAVARMKRSAPAAVVAGIADVNSPKVSRAAKGITVYSWPYLDASGAARTYFMRVDADGHVVALGTK